MNHDKKNGTLFEKQHSNIVLQQTANQPQRKLANRLPYNPHGNSSINFKRKF
ncbi:MULTISPECIES: hypothetical protein [Niastella]|uniref:Uncharacterized protein n=1 Tax=Niastella soli TaxID=2821487 RepID=A0ABS3YZF6_9BACT|nr:hypothetical protein [Niastella soli]MBO9203128.1 hypothetical protein [Niastella soli]